MKLPHTPDPLRACLALRRQRAPLGVPKRAPLTRPCPPAPWWLEDAEAARAASLALAELLRRLDRLLERPLAVQRSPQAKTVWVLDAVGYRIDRARRRIHGIGREGTSLDLENASLELRFPLCTDQFLQPVMQRLGLEQSSWQPDLFKSIKRVYFDVDTWMRRHAYARLLRDTRFAALRRRLAAALRLDPALAGIALAARPPHLDFVLASQVYNFVWQHEAAFRRLARENPRLLQLAYLALREQSLPPFEDDLARGLHEAFREAGVSAAGWRYVARHGSRLFAPLFKETSGRHALQNAIRYVRTLEAAGLPPPPPRRIAARLLWYRQLDFEEKTRLRDEWCPLRPELLRIALLAADRRRAMPDFDQVYQDLPMVIAWARDTQPELDKLQRRAGWPAVLRLAAAHEKREALREAGGDVHWLVPIGPHDAQGLRVIPLTGAAELAEEAIAMHNCLAGRIAACIAGEERFFSLRDPRTGRRVAIAGLVIAGDRWGVGEVKGPANRPAPEQAMQIALGLAEAMTQKDDGLGKGRA